MKKKLALHLSPFRWALASILFGSAVATVIAAIASPGVGNDSRSRDQQAAASAKLAPWVLDHTANGNEAEFLVILPEQADLSGAAALPTKEEKGRYVRDVLWSKAETTQGPVLSWLRERNVEHRSFYIVNMIWVKGSRDLALSLAARPDVLRIEGNPQIQNLPEPLPAEEVSDSPLPNAPEAIEPGITQTRAPEVWATGFTGQGVVIAGADTGYRWTHNGLKSKYRGWDGAVANHDYNWHDSIHSGGGSCGPNSLVPCDDQGHGTHTMGTAVGDDGATNQVGMAPGAKWLGCRNMNVGVGTPATYMECFEFFLAPYPVGGTPAQGDPSKAPDITTNSWGCPVSEGCSANTLQAAVEAQRAAGILTVVSAGNGGSACSTVSSPPSFYDAVYSIGALTTGTDNIAGFSSRGPVTADGSLRRKPDICAPGTSTRSTYRTSDTSYAALSGTSMAAPHVAGGAALLLSARPALRHDVMGIRNFLNQAAVHLLSSTCDGGGPGVSPNNTFGYGRMDVKATVDSVMQLTSVVSRKNHNGAPFDIALPLTGATGVECRNSAGNHTLVFTFDGNVANGSASVSGGVGSVSGSPSFAGNTMTVNLIAVADVQAVTVTLNNVTDGASRTLPTTVATVKMLVGDSNGDSVVNAGDTIQTRSRAGQAANATTFRSDMNLDGFVNSGDTTTVRSRSGNFVP